jgi:hypothetical protein
LTAARLQCIAVLDAQARRVLADEPLLRVGADAQTAGRELVALLSSRLPLSDADARVARDGPEPATRIVRQGVGLLDRP